MHGLLHGADEMVAKWAFEVHQLHPTAVDLAVGVVAIDRSEERQAPSLVGAVLFQSYNGTNVEISYYGRRTLSPGIIRAIARIALEHFRAARVTVVTARRNKRLIRALTRLGFALEGHMHRYYGPNDTPRNTGVRLVMFRDRIEQIARLSGSRRAA